MLIVIGFHLDDSTYRRLSRLDLHANDLLDLMNDTAIENDNRYSVWHLSDEAIKEFDESMGALFADFSTPKTREIIDADT